MTGSTLGNGRYELISPLGEGGMAIVYRAKDHTLGVDRAIKVLHPHVAEKASARGRFFDEARALARLEHPNVVAIQDVVQSEEGAYIVMELVRAKSAADFIERFGPMPPRQAAEVLLGILSALDCSHQNNIIHRDIKPQNVLLSQHGMAKVTDFGIAQLADGTPKTQTGAVLGTWAYMAPEQRVSSKGVDHRADLYSSAATLFVLLTGEEPFELHHPDIQAELLKPIHPALAAIIARAAQVDPDKRYQSAAEMWEAVSQALLSLPASPDNTPPLSALGPTLASVPPSTMRAVAPTPVAAPQRQAAGSKSRWKWVLLAGPPAVLIGLFYTSKHIYQALVPTVVDEGPGAFVEDTAVPGHRDDGDAAVASEEDIADPVSAKKTADTSATAPPQPIAANPVATEQGFLFVSSQPWVPRVVIDGSVMGPSGKAYQVTAGEHRVELKNAEESPLATFSAEVVANEMLRRCWDIQEGRECSF